LFKSTGTARSKTTSGEYDIVVDEDDEKFTTLLGSTLTEEKTMSSAAECTVFKAAARKQGSVRRSQPKELKKITEWHGSSDAALEDEPFYHGYMARAESEKVLTKSGEFLVRKAEVRGREVSFFYFEARCAAKVHGSQFW
ncbi:hypothetical protein COOONC_02178, partial [Cooperia oncophora]